MTAERKNPTGAATSAGAGAENEIGQISFPEFDFTPQRSFGQEGIALLLGIGRSAALTINDLVRLTGLDNRTVRLLIQRERLAGRPICSDNVRGYFMPENDAERVACVRSLRHRASEINRVAAALEMAGNDWTDSGGAGR